MEILSLERSDTSELLSTLRRTRLRGFDGFEIYADASLELVPRVDPEALVPAQNYVLLPAVRRIIELRSALLQEGVDLFDLRGVLWLTTSEHPDERIPLLPPVVEESVEPDGETVLLVNDGMHRIFAARSLGLPVTVVIARNVSADHPYYAYALRGGWAEVQQFEELPDSHQKKNYRRPTNYKALFREFNALFPGVQQQRKRSNPTHLTA